jgi:hypothetical protein
MGSEKAWCFPCCKEPSIQLLTGIGFRAYLQAAFCNPNQSYIYIYIHIHTEKWFFACWGQSVTCSFLTSFPYLQEHMTLTRRCLQPGSDFCGKLAIPPRNRKNNKRTTVSSSANCQAKCFTALFVSAWKRALAMKMLTQDVLKVLNQE